MLAADGSGYENATLLRVLLPSFPPWFASGTYLHVEMDITLDTWITSDQHWGHKRIAEYTNRPADHFELMRERWLEQVSPGDTVLHLGDLAVYADAETLRPYLRDLPGDKFLLFGNHDKMAPDFYSKFGFTVLGGKGVDRREFVDHRGRRKQMPCIYWHSPRDGKRILLSHYPDSDKHDWSVNIHGHIHNDSRAHDALPEHDYRNVSVEILDFGLARLEDVLYGDAYVGRLGDGRQDRWRALGSPL